MVTAKKEESLCSLLIRCSVLCALFFASVTSASEEPNLYYYSSGHKNTLSLSKEILAVRFRQEASLQQREEVVQTDANFASFSQREELSNFNLTLVPLSEGKTKENITKTINNLNAKSEVVAAFPVFHFPDAELILTDEFIVKFAPSVSQAEIEAFNESHNVEIVRKPSWTQRYTLRVKEPNNISALEMANVYYESPITKFALPNFIRRLRPMSVTPDDTYFSSQWALNNTGQNPPAGTADADMDAPEGWDISTGDPNVVIAIIDEGVDINHEDLINKLIDGYDFVKDDDDPSPWGDDAHGTACAGLAGAETDNNKGVAGVSWNCRIMPVRIASGEFYYYWTTDEWAANGIEWAADNGADVLSNSWGGGPDSDTIHDAIIGAKNNGRDGKGCVIVFASGNDSGSVSYPAKYSEVIAVGATDEDDVRWYYSNYGSELDVVAPSSDGESTIFWTADISGSAGYNYGSTSLGDAAGNYTKWMGGTSAATPQVAGLAGLILSRRPNLTSDEVQTFIEESADDKGDPGWDQYYGWGRINVYNALNFLPPVLLTKDDDVDNCAYPYYPGLTDRVNYYIYYDMDGCSDSNIFIIDTLPDDVNYYSSSDPNAYHDDVNNTVTLYRGSLDGNSTETIIITVEVKESAAPGSKMVNLVEMFGDSVYVSDTKQTKICCYGPTIVYVDADADEGGNGLSWSTAYKNLQDAIDTVQSCDCYTSIWVAEGTYKPRVDTNDPQWQYNDSIELPDGIGIFGHFDGNETSLLDRNFADANNETILEGQIGENYYDAVNYIVRAEDIAYAVLDGFTIKGSYSGAGVYLDNSNTAIVDCKLKSNSNYGIQATNYSFTDIHNCLFLENSSQNISADIGSWPKVSYCTFDGNDMTSQGINVSSYTNLDVENSIFKGHTGDGIYGSGNGTLTVTNSTFEGNNDNGIEVSDIITVVTSCFIKNSGDDGIQMSNGCTLDLRDSVIRYNSGYGINLSYNTGTAILNSWIHNNGSSGLYSSNHTANSLLVRNNTIYDNGTYGIECGEYGADPNIINCIIADNDSDDLHRVNGSFNKVNYCLLQKYHSGAGNKTGDPCFMNIDVDADDLHIDETSPCKDAGDPNGNYGSETDIDGEDRIKYARVDIGADEYYWSSADIDEDGFVNFIDYAALAAAWQSESGDGNYNEDCDIEDNNTIDINDLALFCEDWLWQAAWPDKEILLATDFESGIPGGWTVVDGYTDGKTWTTSNPGSRSSEYWTGTFCIVDSDYYNTVDMNESLITPSIDCSGTVEVTLEFSHYYQNYSGEKGDVDISVNNGPWQTILQYTGSSTGGNISEDISTFAADQSNVRIRWHYYDAHNDYYWGIDNIKIIGNYRIPPTQMGTGGYSGFGYSGFGFSGLGRDELIILSAAESLRTRPERLAEKTEKFYAVNAFNAISPLQKARAEKQFEEADIKEILDWLDEIWLSGDLDESITEEEFLEFRKSVEESGFWY
jgi:subtilisin family serine protease